MKLATKLVFPPQALVIDGHSLAYRAYFATLSQLEYAKKNNLFVNNALKTMITMVSKILCSKKYHYGLVAFDTSRKSFRTQIFPDYKSNRQPMPDYLEQQMALIIQMLPFFGFKVLAVKNFEADDLIGTFANICTKNQVDCDIFSSDNDLLQLVNKHVTVNILQKGTRQIKVYNINNFSQLTGGLIPPQIVDVKSLSGDLTDNYKGVLGIGPTKGKQLILKYGSIDQLLANLPQLSSSDQAKILPYQKQVRLFHQLATIKTNVKINNDLKHYHFDFKNDNHYDKLDEFLASVNLSHLKKYFF